MDSMDFDGSSDGMRMDMIASYPTVCRPCADNIKSIYSLVLNFARFIEMQPVSTQNALSGEGNIVSPAPDITVFHSSTAGGRRPPPPVPGRRSTRNSVASASIAQGLRVALFSMGAPKMLPQK